MRALLQAVPVLILAVGCGKPPVPGIPPPAVYDPAAMAAVAFAEYDANKNGFIEGAELNACPGLKNILAGVDTNRDGKVSPDELRARFESYAAANASLIASSVTVTLDGAPLAGATVQFVPEACMGDTAQEATATTGTKGTAYTFTLGGQEQPGLNPGFYRVKITRSDTGGKPLPARYNTQTTLGAEVYGGRGSQELSFALSSH